MSEIEIGFRIVQILTFGLTFVLASRASLHRQRDLAAGRWTKEGSEQFRAYYLLLVALLISIIVGFSLSVQVNPGGVLVLLAAGYCAYTLRPRRPKN